MFLEYYIKPFLDVSINKGFSCYYIDFFSGCGANCVGCGDKKSVGSPIISLIKGIYFNKRKQQHSRFNKWFFIDSNKQYCDALSDRVAKVSQHIYDNTTQNDGVSVSLTLDEDISIINKDCNKAIVDIVTEINNCEKKISVLAFIDPFNYKNIIWQTWIELLKLKYVDIIFTMPISAMKRGLDQDKNCKKYLPPEMFTQMKKRGSILGIEDDEFSNMYAKSITEQVRRAVSYYKKGISAKNSRNGELYRIEFFTHFSPAFNIVKTMASDLEKFSSSDLNNILQCACGQQKTLSECIANR